MKECKLNIRKIKHSEGECFIYPLKYIGNNFGKITDNLENSNRCNIVLKENNTILENIHCVHEEIRQMGGGKYSFWHGALLFSSSNGKNIKKNKYSILIPDEEWSLIIPRDKTRLQQNRERTQKGPLKKNVIQKSKTSQKKNSIPIDPSISQFISENGICLTNSLILILVYTNS